MECRKDVGSFVREDVMAGVAVVKEVVARPLERHRWPLVARVFKRCPCCERFVPRRRALLGHVRDYCNGSFGILHDLPEIQFVFRSDGKDGQGRVVKTAGY